VHDNVDLVKICEVMEGEIQAHLELKPSNMNFSYLNDTLPCFHMF
jgi:hypothetical protein